MKKLAELPQKEFNSNMIDNCFFVDKLNNQNMSSVTMKSVFDGIIKRAKEEGLKVELQSDRIVFISGNN